MTKIWKYRFDNGFCGSEGTERCSPVNIWTSFWLFCHGSGPLSPWCFHEYRCWQDNTRHLQVQSGMTSHFGCLPCHKVFRLQRETEVLALEKSPWEKSLIVHNEDVELLDYHHIIEKSLSRKGERYFSKRLRIRHLSYPHPVGCRIYFPSWWQRQRAVQWRKKGYISGKIHKTSERRAGIRL